MANRDLEKRLAAIEEAIVGKHVELVFVPTRDLAARVEKAISQAASGTTDSGRLLPNETIQTERSKRISERATPRKRRG